MPNWTQEDLHKYEQRRAKSDSLKAKREFWTADQIQSLRTAYSSSEGFDISMLCTSLGKTHAAIACKANDLGICCGRGKQIRTQTSRQNGSAAQKERAQRPGEKDKRSTATAEAWKQRGHPRGFLGHKRTKQDLDAIRAGVKKAWADPNHIYNSQQHRQGISDRSSKAAAMRPARTSFSRVKYGHREDLGGMFFRSSWEANYARYLNFLIRTEAKIDRWEYESETFWFNTIKRGCRSYKPDFKVFLKSGDIEFHEVKGWMYARSKTALSRMAKYYPRVRVIVIDQARYSVLVKQVGNIIPGWEFPSKRSNAANRREFRSPSDKTYDRERDPTICGE